MSINVGDDPTKYRPHMLSPDQFAFTPRYGNSTGHTPAAIDAVNKALERWPNVDLDAQGLYEKSTKMPMSALARMATSKVHRFDAHVSHVTGKARP